MCPKFLRNQRFAKKGSEKAARAKAAPKKVNYPPLLRLLTS
jgi:hypothetical protein